MVARDRAEPHRAATPLELLFDLSFVVAVAQAAATLHHEVIEGHAGDGVLGYALVFFAIWWAWMNFTWFASAYDTDDVPYRLLTLVQIAGVLVLAAGVPVALQDQEFATVTYGYVVMRVALIAQWLRVAAQHRPGRAHAIRYAVGIAVVQAGWLARLALPENLALPSFLLLAAAELAVPIWAEYELRRPIPWHPDHIAERYGLFTIIVLGESILAATVTTQEAIDAHGVSGSLLIIAAAGLALIFGLWWTYFDRPAADGLRVSPRGVFRWGYGHLIVFASLAAVGAGLEVVAETAHHVADVPPRTAALAVGIPVAAYLVAAGVLHTWINRHLHQGLIGPFTAAAGLVLVAAVATPPLSLPAAVAAMAIVVGGLVAYDLVTRPTQAARSAKTSGH
jgi:low temperature requirement protein LtrA